MENTKMNKIRGEKGNITVDNRTANDLLELLF